MCRIYDEFVKNKKCWKRHIFDNVIFVKEIKNVTRHHKQCNLMQVREGVWLWENLNGATGGKLHKDFWIFPSSLKSLQQLLEKSTCANLYLSDVISYYRVYVLDDQTHVRVTFRRRNMSGETCDLVINSRDVHSRTIISSVLVNVTQSISLIVIAINKLIRAMDGHTLGDVNWSRGN